MVIYEASFYENTSRFAVMLNIHTGYHTHPYTNGLIQIGYDAINCLIAICK